MEFHVGNDELAHSEPSASSQAERPQAPRPRWSLQRREVRIAVGVLAVLLLAVAVPRVYRAFVTVSTDDAYVSGHVTFVAPRVAGQVARVLVDDNNRVRKGDVLVQLDKEPYEVQVGIAEAAVEAAQANLAAALAQTRGQAGRARSLRFGLQTAIQDVDNQTALLRSRVATLTAKRAVLSQAQADYERAAKLVESGVASKQHLEVQEEARNVARADVEAAQEDVYRVRAALGLPAHPAPGSDLAQVPANLNQNLSEVKEAQAKLMQIASELGVTQSFDASPDEMLAEFYRRDPEGNIDRILDQLVRESPAVRQAEAKLSEAKRNLDEAQLRLRYCDVTAEIDGVVTRRSVNPGNNVVVGQSLLAVRSLTDIWVDANFKETQLAELRIGQPVDLDVDMYGGSREFHGRISGFTMGTGSTLALLPAENATGNFVKVVQRLPVRIDLVDYDPDQAPLFVGLSVTPRVWIHEEPSGLHAGQILQPYAETRQVFAAPVSAKEPTP
jgi:membrane fusion protein (multidrug efflux system)